MSCTKAYFHIAACCLLPVMNINETDHRSLTQWSIPLLAAAQPHYHNSFNWPQPSNSDLDHRSEVVDERDERV